jgi:hypothetical protein
MGIGGLRGGKIGADGKMHYNPGWEPGSMKTLAAHGLPNKSDGSATNWQSNQA